MQKRGKVLGSCVILNVFLVVFCAGAFALDWGKSELDNEKLAVQFHRDVTAGAYKIVTTEELKAWVDAKEPMLIIDTMPLEASYNKNHIPGAVQFLFPIETLESMDDKARADYEKLLGPDKHRKIVVYCGFTSCTRSHNGAMWAVKLGYDNVYRHPGGIKGWMEAGYPAAKAQ